MAAKKPALDDKHSFKVDLAKPVRVGRATIIPGPRVVMRGDILSAVITEDADAVRGYEVIEA